MILSFVYSIFQMILSFKYSLFKSFCKHLLACEHKFLFSHAGPAFTLATKLVALPWGSSTF